MIGWRVKLAAAAWIACAACRDVTMIGAEHLPDAGVDDAGVQDASVTDASVADAGVDAAIDAAIFDGPYLEAEDGVLSEFVVEDSAEASGGQALLAPNVFSDAMPGTARATYAFELAEAGDYILWGRVYAPDIHANRLWLQIDGGSWVKWRISTGEAWFWDDVHDNAEYGTPLTFTLAAGVHELVIANAGPRARLDRLYFTKDGDEPPGNDTPCRPPHTVELGGECVPSCGLLMGTACGPVDCMGLPPLPAYDCDVCCQPNP
jgi:hypothetical protein